MPRSAQAWFDEYSESHRNPTNKALHWVCVPVILLSVVGFLWALPFPDTWRAVSPFLNWATLVALLAVIYYFTLSSSLGVGMIAVMGAMLMIVHWLGQLPVPLWITCATLFVVAWIGQFIGHAVEGKRPSFLKDIQFLMIGPLWLLAHVFRRAGIPF
ncbi:MAG TPA: Mpo1-like protein [Steroidobacteraceae bacterium]|nr:Mpo1-like protein [Steroidobacteraceae bacterium]